MSEIINDINDINRHLIHAYASIADTHAANYFDDMTCLYTEIESEIEYMRARVHALIMKLETSYYKCDNHDKYIALLNTCMSDLTQLLTLNKESQLINDVKSI